MIARPGESREAIVQGFPTGLAGTVGFEVQDNVGGITIARVTTGITELQVSGVGTGTYTKTFTVPSTAGDYTILWDKGLPVTPSGVATEDLAVSYTAVVSGGGGPLYITRAEIKATLGLTAETFADADIDQAISAACRGIDRACGRRFYPDGDATHKRYYTPVRPDTVAIGDLVSLTSLKTDNDGDGVYETTWTINRDFVLEPINAGEEGFGEPYTRIRVHPLGQNFLLWPWPRSVEVTGQFGWAAVPDQVKSAAGLIATRLMRRAREAPFGIVSIGLEGEAARIASHDPDVAFLLEDLNRKPIIA